MYRFCVCVLMALCVSACLSLSRDVKKTPSGKKLSISRKHGCCYRGNNGDSLSSLGRRKRYHLSDSGGWKKKNLTYKFINSSSTLPSDVVEELFRDALGQWAPHAGITFTKSEQGRPDITVLFYKGEHSCPLVFDGEGGYAADADSPKNDGPLQIHFDNDEDWYSFDEGESQTGLRGKFFHGIAIHEIGHALGLKHSDEHNAIMYPEYWGQPGLHEDDIRAIEELYPPDSDQPPDFCYCNYDTLQDLGGSFYGFKDQWVWLYKDRHIEGKPKLLQEVFIGLPHIRHVSAAYMTYNGTIAIFYRRAIYEFDRNFNMTSTRDLSRFGLPQSTLKLNAVFLSDQDNKTYLFEKKQYWRYDERTEKMDPGYPKPMSNKITSAMVTQGRTCFFKRCGYWYPSKDSSGGFIPDKPERREVYDVTTHFMWPCVLQD